MNIWLKEIDVNDGLEYYELLSVLSSYEDAHARPVLGEFTLEDYEYFKRARVAMASGVNLPNNVVRTDTYYVMNNYEPIGYALLRHEVDINKPGGHLGCCLKKEYQNMGIGSVVSELLTKRAYYDLGIENIIYTSKNENIQSQKSLSKIGAKILKIENGYHFYSLDLTKKYERESEKKHDRH